MKQIFFVLLVLSFLSYGCGKKTDDYKVCGSVQKEGYTTLLFIKNSHELVIYNQLSGKTGRGERGEEKTVAVEEEVITSACWGSGERPDIFYSTEKYGIKKIYRNESGFEEAKFFIR